MTMCSATVWTSTKSSRTKLVCVTDDVDRIRLSRTTEFKLIARPLSPDISPQPSLGDDCASDQRIIIDRQLKNRNLNVECDRSSYLRPQSRCTRTLANNRVITHVSDDFCGHADPSTTQPAFLDRMKVRFAQFKASVVPS
ncbi:uncharacterized protein LOC112560279 [Pomacea canaliculata]|uniref:uncharacterized protein LOC112560279 n=1 Tax=Pomacea canaliculata TaxID=400727 RepID=UPI000D73845F|nr:uncharacterized protein LOC112560279 [Pomacea canaliculata]